jgi:hypothetical protein
VSARQDQTTDDRVRLERFLEWERARKANRRASRRRVLSYLAGMVPGVVAFALVTWLTAGSQEMPGRVASEQERAPAESAPVERALAESARAESVATSAGDSVPAVPPVAARQTLGIERPAPPRVATTRKARTQPWPPPPSPRPAPEVRVRPSDKVATAVAPAPTPSAPVTTPSGPPAPPAAMVSAPAPTPTAAAPAKEAPVPIQNVVTDSRSEPVEMAKPEVPRGKTISRWMKSQAPAEAGARPAETERLQTY